MSKHSTTMHLAVPPEEAMSACRRGIDRHGWEISAEEEGRLSGGEEPPLTSCRAPAWPVRIEISIEPESSERATVTIIGSMTGFGSKAEEHLRHQIATLEQRIRDSLGSGA